jgi:ABC-type uncharacterized transport system auxiliary subunit
MNETAKAIATIVFALAVCASLCGCKGAAQSDAAPQPTQAVKPDSSATKSKGGTTPGDSMILPAGQHFQDRVGTALKGR